ncbi:MAG: hypothetical protein ABIJ48_04005 [Actinomycetota bacterium]
MDAIRWFRDQNGTVCCDLGPVSPRVRAACRDLEALAIILEVLSVRYLPRVLHIMRGPSDQLQELIWSQDPSAEYGLLGLEGGEAIRQAELLLAQAASFDPLGKWHRVVRIASPRKWEELRGDARIALDHRVAAEMLLLYAEDLAAVGKGPSLPPLSARYWNPRHDRLSPDARERSETLLDFGLADTPALVVALEGATERILMPKVLDLLGVSLQSGAVDFVDLNGVGGDVRLLARSRGVPRIDPDGYVGARVLRPLTSLLVAVDPEGAYSTPDGCEGQRQAMIDEVFDALPAEVQTDSLRDDLGHLFHVLTWGRASFEYAHFSDAELACAIADMAGDRCPDTSSNLEAAVAKHRANRSDIEKIWKKWRLSGCSKTALARRLWPTLKDHIDRADSPDNEPPILRVGETALDMIVSVQGIRELRTDKTVPTGRVDGGTQTGVETSPTPASQAPPEGQGSD